MTDQLFVTVTTRYVPGSRVDRRLGRESTSASALLSNQRSYLCTNNQTTNQGLPFPLSGFCMLFPIAKLFLWHSRHQKPITQLCIQATKVHQKKQLKCHINTFWNAKLTRSFCTDFVANATVLRCLQLSTTDADPTAWRKLLWL